ncbi:MAG: hypothetical protein Q9186_002146 [Xanthomendoza sp. 1 TL-2023]
MHNPFRQRSIDPSRIHDGDIEKALSQLCAPPGIDKKTGSQPSISDTTFKRIAELLNHLQAHQYSHGWSDRPRTYTVLRNINRLDLFPKFIDHGLNDISFPYTIEKLPDLIQEDSLQDKFLRHQRYILTDASQLEDGVHALTKNGDDLYRLIRHLGRGGFGSVDQVWSRMSFREFARKKFLRKTTSKADQKILKNFENELTNLKRLSHQHLVKVVGSYTDQKSVAFLMEPVANMNLMTFLENVSQDHNNVMSPSLRSYFGCLANAVGYLHTKRIKHRDLKPENILIKDYKVYIADFGTAQDWSHAPNDTTTDSGVPITAPYMAPEVARRSPRNSAADMWSLGVVYLEMVTVLRGQSLHKMRKFIANHGTKHPYVFGNGPATTQWFEELRLNGRGPASDNEPLSWIKDLTQLEPQRRPKPWALTGQIRSSASSTAFIGICCAEEDEIHDYPSPPSSAGSEEEAPLQEKLEALGLFERPHGSFLQPHKQSSLELWRADVSSGTAAYTMSLWDGGVFSEPYELAETELVGSQGFTNTPYTVERHNMEDHNIVENCYGYDIAEDDSDEENKMEENAYAISEDSSGSGSTARPMNVQFQASRPFPITGKDRVQQDTPLFGSLSSSAVIEQLDSVPELPESPEPVAPAATTFALTPQLTTSATSGVPTSHWLPWYSQPSGTPTLSRHSDVIADISVLGDQNDEASKAKNPPKAEQESKSKQFALGLTDTFTSHRKLPSHFKRSETPTKAERTVSSTSASDQVVLESPKALITDKPFEPNTERKKTEKAFDTTESSTSYPELADRIVSSAEAPNLDDEQGAALTADKLSRLAPGTGHLRSKKCPRKETRNVSFTNVPDPIYEKGDALTEVNLSKLGSGTKPSSKSRPDRPRHKNTEYDAKPKMTAGYYMQEVWEAASTIQTSVLDAKTQKAFAQLGPGIVWQDRTQHLVESYAKQGKAAAVRELLRAGCNPGTRKKPRWKPLLVAIKAGTQRHNKVVKALLDHGADVNARDPVTGKTSLHFAIENPFFPGYTNIIRILLEHGADANALDKNKDSPLLQILYGGYKPLEKHKRDALACLMQDHIDVDVNVMPLGTLDMPIHLAVRRRDAIAVAILVHRGSRVTTANSTGLTPLQIAASTWSETIPEDDIEVLKHLILGGATITGDEQHTVLEMAARQGCVQAVNLLLNNLSGANVIRLCQSAAKAATANKSKMSKASYTALMQILESAQA